jgi:AraC-like DNA-binding protein
VSGGRSIISTPSLASVLSPDEPIEMLWSPQSPQFDVYFDRSALERQLEALLGGPLGKPLRFSLGMELFTQPSRSWLQLVNFLRDQFERKGVLLRQPLAAAQLEELLMTVLLIAQPSNYSELLRGEPSPLSPRAFRRVLEHVEAHLHDRLTVGELGRFANVSVRSLQQSFRRHLDTTPTAHIRDLRLQRAHADLVSADPSGGTSVTEIAARWGFTHLGRFSSAYRRAFGVTPSRTLRS